MPHPSPTVALPIRVAAALLWATSFGFGIAAVLTATNVLRGRGLPMILGFRAFGGGAFERHGMRAMTVLLIAFLVVCAFETVAGWWIWEGLARGAWLALGLLPIGAVFWWGFALPIPPTLAVVRTLLILLNWHRLT